MDDAYSSGSGARSADGDRNGVQPRAPPAQRLSRRVPARGGTRRRPGCLQPALPPLLQPGAGPCLRLGLAVNDADEVVAQAFAATFLRSSAAAGRGDFLPYLFVAVRNMMVALIRRRPARVTLVLVDDMERLAGADPVGDIGGATAGRRRALWSACNSLSSRWRPCCGAPRWKASAPASWRPSSGCHPTPSPPYAPHPARLPRRTRHDVSVSRQPISVISTTGSPRRTAWRRGRSRAAPDRRPPASTGLSPPSRT